jgi:hypothetical protein
MRMDMHPKLPREAATISGGRCAHCVRIERKSAGQRCRSGQRTVPAGGRSRRSATKRPGRRNQEIPLHFRPPCCG